MYPWKWLNVLKGMKVPLIMAKCPLYVLQFHGLHTFGKDCIWQSIRMKGKKEMNFGSFDACTNTILSCSFS